MLETNLLGGKNNGSVPWGPYWGLRAEEPDILCILEFDCLPISDFNQTGEPWGERDPEPLAQQVFSQ